MINILSGFVDSGWYYSLSPCPPLGTDAHTQHNRPVYNLWSVWRVCVFFHLAQMNISTRYWRQIIIQRTHSDGLSLLVCGNCYRLCWHSKCSRLVFAWIEKNRNLYVAQSNCRRRLQPTKFKTFQTNKRWKSSREEWETAWRKTNQTWNGCVHHRFVMLIVAFIIRSRKC